MFDTYGSIELAGSGREMGPSVRLDLLPTSKAVTVIKKNKEQKKPA